VRACGQEKVTRTARGDEVLRVPRSPIALEQNEPGGRRAGASHHDEVPRREAEWPEQVLSLLHDGRESLGPRVRCAREHPATSGALERDERVELLGEDVGPCPPHEEGRDENDGGTDAPTAVQ
jgi:hypothetical protein